MRSFIPTLTTLATSLALSSIASSKPVTTNGMKFEVDGAPYTFSGANLWTFGATDDGYAVDTVKAAKLAGYKVIRAAAWFMKDPSTGLLGTYGKGGENYFMLWENGKFKVNTGSNGLQLMDKAVKEAEDGGIKLIMCLTNMWKDNGGIQTYVSNLLGPGKSPTEFYTNPTVIDAYKDYVSQIINRYKDSSAILAWELANELRCQDADCDGSKTMTKWSDEVSSFIKTSDPTHLVTTGYVGFFDHGKGANNYDYEYNGFTGESFDDLLALQNIDFGTVHLYTNHGGSGADSPEYGLQWLKDHNDAAVKAGKPIIMEELGVNRTSPDIGVGDVLGEQQEYILESEAYQRKFGVEQSLCFSYDNYAVCTKDPFYEKVVTDFSAAMNKKGQ